jgi:hypothetical protein
VNGDDKPRNDNPRHDAHADDLAEQLSRLQAVDRRITPGHVARRFRELQRAMREAAVPDIEQPTQRARLISVMELLSAAESAGIERPLSLAKLTVAMEPFRPLESADIEQPTHLAEWVVSVEPLPR